jgi:hypothetical protein
MYEGNSRTSPLKTFAQQGRRERGGVRRTPLRYVAATIATENEADGCFQRDRSLSE